MVQLETAMSENKKVIENYRDSFSRGNRDGVLSYLSDDVEWIEWADGFADSGVPRRGKTAFIENISDPPGGWPLQYETTRMTEENNVVVVEGTVRVPMKDGSFFKVQSCNIFEVENGKVKRLTSWTAEARDST